MKKIIFLILMLMGIPELPAAIYPPSLKPGDKIAILAPAGHVKRERVDGAAETLRSLGYEPVIYPSVDKKNGQFSGTPRERFADLKEAFLDPEIRAILCARGGFGMVHNLDSLAELPIESDPKWVIGFSDISALHALMASKNIASIHSSMAEHIARGMDEEENVTLFNILRGDTLTYEFESDPRNHPGQATGRLLGGNLSVIQALIGTPFNVIKPGTILFIEDVGEEIYKIERIMYQLRHMGVLDNLQGLILGQFTNCPPGENYPNVEAMMEAFLEDYPDLPVMFNAPIGHVRHNVPVIESAEVALDITPEGVTLTFEPPGE